MIHPAKWRVLVPCGAVWIGMATGVGLGGPAAAQRRDHGDQAAPAIADAASSREPQGVVTEPGTGLFEESLSGAALAEDEGSAGDRGNGLSGFDLDGYVRSDVFVGRNPGSDAAELQAGYGELSLQVRGPREPHGSAFADLRVRYGQQLDRYGQIVDLREAYVDVYAGPVDLRLGKQIVVWGRADAFNPTNNLVPFDLRIRSPIEDDRRVGNVGARGFLNLSAVRIEGVWMPLYVPAEYPPFDPDEYVVITDPVFPAPALSNGLGAVRVHLELPAFEASASYLYGPAPLPGITLRGYTAGPPELGGKDPPEVYVARASYAQHVIGVDFSTAVYDLFALRGEAAYRYPVDYADRVQAPRPDLQYVLGIDRAFGTLMLIAQYMGRYTFDWQRELGPDMPVTARTLLEQTPPLPALTEQEITSTIEEQIAVNNQMLFSQLAEVQHLITARAEWRMLHDTLFLSALGMANLTTEEWLLSPKLEYRFSDAIRAYAGAELFVGPKGTLFDLIDDRLTAGYAELRYTF